MLKKRDYFPKEPGEQFVAVFLENGSIQSRTLLVGKDKYYEHNHVTGKYYDSNMAYYEKKKAEYIWNVEG